MVASMPFAFNRIRYSCFNAISPGWISLELGLSTLNRLRQATAETLWLFLYQDMWSKEVRELARYYYKSLGMYIKIQ